MDEKILNNNEEQDIIEAMKPKKVRKSKNKFLTLSEQIDEDKKRPDIVNILSTGLPNLDAIIGGGVESGMMTELYGDTGTFKTTLGFFIMKQIQQKGGKFIFINSENSLSKKRLDDMGIDMNNIIIPDSNYTNVNIIEESFKSISDFIDEYGGKGYPIGVLFDSISSCTSVKESESDYEAQLMATNARAITKGFRQSLNSKFKKYGVYAVLINHIKDKMDNHSFIKKYYTGGGKGIGYWANLRLRLKIFKSNKIENKYGIKMMKSIIISAVVEKSKITSNGRETYLPIFMSSNCIDPYYVIFFNLKLYGIITGNNKGKDKIHVLNLDGNEISFPLKDFREIYDKYKKEIDEVFWYIYNFMDKEDDWN